MPIPWLRLLNAAVGATTLVRRVSGRSSAGTDGGGLIASLLHPDNRLEARLAGVVVAALKEAFDRDHTRLEIEREHIEAERRRAERALRLELLRQAGERELSRLRLLAGVAVAIWIGTLFLSASLVAASTVTRAGLGVGWLLLLASLAAVFLGQSRIGRRLDGIMELADQPAVATDAITSGGVGRAAPWLIVAGLAAIAVGILAG
jgi:hypothetical protein